MPKPHFYLVHPSPPVALNFDAGINSYVGKGKQLYVIGSRVGEPVGIWRYDAASASISCVVSNPQSSFTHARKVYPSRETATAPDGTLLSHRIWSPPNVSPRKTYPLVIGKTGNRWQGYPATVANGGAYFVSIERDDPRGDWSAEVVPLYEHLQSKLQIDTNNVYLAAVSGDVPKANLLLATRPELWRGAILYSPGIFPDLTRIKTSKILIDAGTEDVRAEAITKFRDDAAQAGIVVSVAMHDGAGHVYRSISSMRDRDVAVMKFLFGR